MKQAIARNLNDPQLANAPVIPTDRVGLDRLPEEDMPTEDLVQRGVCRTIRRSSRRR